METTNTTNNNNNNNNNNKSKLAFLNTTASGTNTTELRPRTIHIKHNEYSDELIRNFENKIKKTTKKVKTGLEKFVEEEVNEEPTPSTS
jgi:hypothetical protein